MAFATLFSRQGYRVTSILVFLFLASLLSTKSGYSYVLGVLTLYSLWQLQGPRVELERPEARILIWMGLFALLGIFSAAWHGGPADAYEVPAKFALGIVLVLSCIKLPPHPASFWAGLVVGAVSGLAVAYWKMLQSGEFKAFGYTGAIQFGNLALTMGVILIVGLYWTVCHRCAHRRLWIAALAVGAVCGLLGSYFSGTRGGWVAIPVFLTLFLVAFLRRGNLLPGLLTSAVIVASGAAVGVYSPLVQKRIQDVSQDLAEYKDKGTNSSSSLGARFAIWETSLELLKEKPVLGWGEVRFRQELRERVEAGQLGEIPATLANTHNTFLEVWVMYGGLALIALLGTLISSAWYFLTYLRHADSVVQSYALAGLCLVLGYVVYGQTQIMLIRNNTLIFYLVVQAVLAGLLHQRRLLLRQQSVSF